MDVNFEYYFVWALCLCAVMYALDKLWFAPKRKLAGKTSKPLWMEYTGGMFWPLLAVIIVRSFIFQIVVVPTSSLAPTVIPTEFLWVEQYSYGLRLPIWHREILSVAKPKVGELAVFHWPVNPDKYFVKRVIGTPGDYIEYKNKHLIINGHVAMQSAGHLIQDPDSAQPYLVVQRQEQLGEVKHSILLRKQVARGDFSLTVPKDHYFMMGDNRDNSNDSRSWGMVQTSAIVGKPAWVLMSWDPHQHKPRWSRIGERLV